MSDSPHKNTRSKTAAASAAAAPAAKAPRKFASTTPPSWIMKVIPDENLRALEGYKYQGTDLSILVELFLRSFWNWCIEFFPLWLAYLILIIFHIRRHSLLVVFPAQRTNFLINPVTHRLVPAPASLLPFPFNMLNIII